MKSSSSSILGGWAVLLLLTVASLAFGYIQLDELPDLGVRFGPDLTVRAVPVDRESDTERQEFKRGDRLVALEGQSVSGLRELRAVLQNLPADIEAPEQARVDAHGELIESEPSAGAPPQPGASRKASYQIVRPLYRFPVALQGKPQDPTALPPGVEPADRLVELDGRKLQTKVGPEGVRSIVASRPEALLVFERKDAVFSGIVNVPQPDAPLGVLGIFGAVVLVLGGVWWFRAEELEPTVPIAIGFETLCFGWIGLLAYEYQWVLSDEGLTAVVLVAFCLVRPTAFFARNIGDGRGTQAGWSALLVGMGAAGATVALFLGGYFVDAEQALHVAALITGLFVVYEIFVASIESDAPGSSLGEGSGYIAWILVLALFSALLAWYMVPIAFEEDRWRWFATIIVGLVWFGDLLYCFHGLSAEGWAKIATKVDREVVMLEYLDVVKMLVPDARSFFVVYRADESLVFEPQFDGLRISSSPAALHDAMAILVQERARIPLPPPVDRQTHPMSGIARAMDMVLAMPLTPPDGAVEVDDFHMILVSQHAGGAGDEAAEAFEAEPDAQTLDLLQGLLSAEVWAAVLIEALIKLHAHGGQAGAAATTPGVQTGQESKALLAERRRVKELEAQLEALRQTTGQTPVTDAEVPRASSRVASLTRPNAAVLPADEPEEIENEIADHEEDKAQTAVGQESDAQPVDADDAPASDAPASDAPASDAPAAAEVPAEPEGELPDEAQNVPEAPALPEPRRVEPAPPHYAALLEPELVDALQYLLESDEPIVLGGARGAGKRFIVRCAHHLELDTAGELRLLEAFEVNEISQETPEWVERTLGQLGDDALLVVAAEQLSDASLQALCDAAADAGTRLYLAFEAADAEENSVLADHPPALRERLEHRELIVPPLAHRPTVLRAAMTHFLAESLETIEAEYRDVAQPDEPPRHTVVRKFSADALQALLAYDYPGQFEEARELVQQAVRHAENAPVSRAEILLQDLDFSA